MPVSPSNPPDRPGVERPDPRQIWTRSLIMGAVLALFIAIAFGRFESERILSLFILWSVPLVLVLGGVFTWLNRSPGQGGGGR